MEEKLAWTESRPGMWTAVAAHGVYVLQSQGRGLFQLAYLARNGEPGPTFPVHEQERAAQIAQAHSDGIYRAGLAPWNSGWRGDMDGLGQDYFQGHRETLAAKKFEVGDKVRLTGAFLRNTGQYTGPEGQSVWSVMAIDGDFVVTDQEKEDLTYFTPEELEADPSLRYRRIHAANLIRVGKPDYSGFGESEEIRAGTRIYYTGDMANQSGHFEVVSTNGHDCVLRELDGELSEGRTFHIRLAQIGHVYQGHANPRFVTEAARQAYRASFGEGDEAAEDVSCGKGVPFLKLVMSKERCSRAGAKKLSTPQAVADFVRREVGCSAREHMFAIYLDSQNQALGVSEISRGAIAQTVADPRVILAPAVQLGASGMMLIHNHPSNVSEPSQDDVRMTRTIKSGAELLGVRLVDHIIVTQETFTSFVMRGLL